MEKLNVLMIGPARNVKGGMTTVVNNYFEYGLKEKVNLKYIETINDNNKISKFFKEIKGLIEFKKYINNYEIIHIHMASRRSTFRKGKYIKIAKEKEKKVIIHMHGGGFKDFYEKECNSIKKKKVKKILNSADEMIVLSDEWKEYFQNIVPKERITVIHNGTKIPSDFNKNLNNKSILFLGRLNAEKGIYDLLEVIKKIKKEYSDVLLSICGVGEDIKIANYIKNYDLTKNVKILGWIDGKEKERQLKDNTYFILPSYYEALPMSLIEAMAYKCISIATNVGGIPRIIDNGTNGIMVNPGDIDNITNSLIELMENEKKREKISSEARKKIIKSFSIDESINKTFMLYKKITNRNK